jgi:hypothetical protein
MIAPGAGLAISTTLGNGTSPPCYARQAMNNGASGSLAVTAPASAASGDWAVLVLYSFREDPSTCWPPADDDRVHMWAVGVHVP